MSAHPLLALLFVATAGGSAHAGYVVENGVARGTVTISSEADAQRLADVSLIVGELQIINFDGRHLHALRNLMQVDGDVTIATNAQLTSLDGLARLERINGSLSLWNNPRLESLSGMTRLRSVYSLMVTDHPRLTRLMTGPIQLGQPARNLKGFVDIAGNGQLPQAEALAFAKRCYHQPGATILISQNGK